MRYRFAKPEDLLTLQAMLAEDFSPSEQISAALPGLWQQLIEDGRMRVTVIEDPELATPLGIQAIGASGFVSSDFVTEYLADPEPGLTARIYNGVLAGKGPLLSEHEVRVANSAEGLHLVMLHFALRNPDLGDERVQQVMFAVNAAFFFFYGGYRMRTLMQEVFGLQAAQYMQAGGFHIFSEFPQAQLPAPGRASRDVHPYLLVLRKEEVQPSVVNPLSFLFYPVPPRIYFSPAEQKLLELALLNQSDVEISRDLGLSLDTVKKRWRQIYQRTSQVTPNLLGAEEPNEGATSRGTEKRRHLLDYLRIHLEELRPSIAPR